MEHGPEKGSELAPGQLVRFTEKTKALPRERGKSADIPEGTFAEVREVNSFWNYAQGRLQYRIEALAYTPRPLVMRKLGRWIGRPIRLILADPFRSIVRVDRDNIPEGHPLSEVRESTHGHPARVSSLTSTSQRRTLGPKRPDSGKLAAAGPDPDPPEWKDTGE